MALNRAAEEAGLSCGMALTDACAILPSLKTEAASPVEEERDLKKLAAWCRRYTPWTAPKPPDVIALDVTGACHLLGGEEELLDDLIERLRRFGLTARTAMAGSLGAAWALSHHGNTSRIVVPRGEEAHFIAPLPVQGLRLDEAQAALLKRLGLGVIGQLFALPREALRARLGLSILLRLDQALGEQAEPLSPLEAATVYAAHLNFAEPISTLDSLAYVSEHLAKRVTVQLKRDGRGARRFRLIFYDTQGGIFTVSVSLAKPSHERLHVLRLFREKFTRFESRFDASLGFDAASLQATRTERLVARQSDLDGSGSPDFEQQERLASLLDRLSARLGDDAAENLTSPQHSPVWR